MGQYNTSSSSVVAQRCQKVGHPHTAYTLPSPTGFFWWVSCDFSSFPPLHQHLHSVSYHHLSSGLVVSSLLSVLIKSTLVLLLLHSLYTKGLSSKSSDSTLPHCTIPHSLWAQTEPRFGNSLLSFSSPFSPPTTQSQAWGDMHMIVTVLLHVPIYEMMKGSVCLLKFHRKIAGKTFTKCQWSVLNHRHCTADGIYLVGP